MQPEVAPYYLRKIWIPQLTSSFQQRIAELFRMASAKRQREATSTTAAESLLLDALGLANWQPPEPLTYTRTAAEAFAAGRLDAEHYQPIDDHLFQQLRDRGALRLGDVVAEKVRRGISPTYVEDGDLLVINSQHVSKTHIILDDNRTTSSQLLGDGSRTGLVRQGDVLLNSTGRITIGRCQALLEDARAVAENHVAIIRPTSLTDPIYLATYLNALPGQLQTERSYTGSSGQIELRPDLVEDYLIWQAPLDIQKRIRDQVENAYAARRRAHRLLDAAKRAVEIAIESSEADALAYLAAQED